MASRFGRFALLAFVVGLPLHNLAMAELWDLGVRGATLDVVSAWKEALLAVALVLVVVERRGLPFKATVTDWLAFAYGAFVLVYAVIPQSWLGGNADAHGILFAVRHDLTPLAAYVLGRSLSFGREDLRRIGATIVAVAAAVAAWGLVDIYALGLDTWRSSGVPGWYREQLGLRYQGLSGLPENFVYNTGDERPLRRLVSTFLSPLATGYLLVVALLAAAALRRRWVVAAAALAFAGLLFTYSRTSIAALALGLAVLAWAARSWLPLAAAVAVGVVGLAFVEVYPSVGPRDSYTPAELEVQRAGGQAEPTSGDATSFSESSVSSHLDSLRDGIGTVARHPWGYGPGNAGVTAKRTGEEIKAGESTYTELGAELGLLGLLAFAAWNLALLARIFRRAPWLAASLASVLGLGIQTDVIGVHWLAFVVWLLAGERA